jgi:hypothetical protein
VANGWWEKIFAVRRRETYGKGNVFVVRHETKGDPAHGKSLCRAFFLDTRQREVFAVRPIESAWQRLLHTANVEFP